MKTKLIFYVALILACSVLSVAQDAETLLEQTMNAVGLDNSEKIKSIRIIGYEKGNISGLNVSIKLVKPDRLLFATMDDGVVFEYATLGDIKWVNYDGAFSNVGPSLETNYAHIRGFILAFAGEYSALKEVADIELLEQQTFNDETCDVIRIKIKHEFKEGLLYIRTDDSLPAALVMTTQGVSYSFSDWKTFDGISVPGLISIKTESDTTELEISSVEYNVEIPDTVFDKPVDF